MAGAGYDISASLAASSAASASLSGAHSSTGGSITQGFSWQTVTAIGVAGVVATIIAILFFRKGLA